MAQARAYALWGLAMLCFAVLAIGTLPLYAVRRDVVGWRRDLGGAIADISVNLLRPRS
jgi:hypothetical protein